MDLELQIDEHSVDTKITEFLRKRINLRPESWIKDFPVKGTRTLKAKIYNVEEIEQKRIQLFKGKLYKDAKTGQMFSVHKDGKIDCLTLINN
jgi:hypothetical protein